MIEKIANEKNQLILIIKRIVIDDQEKNQLIHKIGDHPNSIPLKAILERLYDLETLPLNQNEKEILDDLKFIYI